MDHKMNLRRFLAVLLVLAMALGLAACGKEEGAAEPVSYSLTLDQTALTIAEDTRAVLTATAQPEGTVKWESSDESILSVSGGALLAKKPGNVTVTASIGQATAACQVTVTASDGSFLYLEPDMEYYPVEIGGKSQQVSFTLYQVTADGTRTKLEDAQVTYTLENKKLASLEGKLLTGLVSGVTAVTAASGDYSATAEVRIYNKFITTAEEWCQMLAARTLGEYYMLAADIDFAGKSYTGTYTGAPASVKAQSFRATLDGNGHTVKNIKLSGSGYQSLFGQLYNAKIRDIAFENVEITAATASGLATCISGQNTLVENVSLDLWFIQAPSAGYALYHTAFGGSTSNVLVTVQTPGKDTKADNVRSIGSVHSLAASGVYLLAQGAIEPCEAVAAYTSKMEMAAAVNSQMLLPAEHWSYSGGAQLPVLIQD